MKNLWNFGEFHQMSSKVNVLEYSSTEAQILAWFCRPNEPLDSNLTKKFPYVTFGKKKPSPGSIKISGDGNRQRFVLILVFKDKKSLSVCLKKISKIKGLKSIAFPDSPYNNYILEWAETESEIKVLLPKQAPEEPSKKFLLWVWNKLKEDPDIDTEKLKSLYKAFSETWEKTCLEEYLRKFTPYGWEDFFLHMRDGGYIQDISETLSKEKKSEISPNLVDVFAAFEFRPPEELKVVIIGQDPYPTPGAAMGLAFSTPKGWYPLQPSLKNIYKELISEGYEVDKNSGNLTYWAEQGVFLINTSLTVLKGKTGSHFKIWEKFTDQLFMYLNNKCEHLVVIMWGLHAKKRAKYFDDKKHAKIYGVHPSPFNRGVGFLGTKPFSKANTYLVGWKYKPIDWSLTLEDL